MGLSIRLFWHGVESWRLSVKDEWCKNVVEGLSVKDVVVGV
jgi:hypothetical protein